MPTLAQNFDRLRQHEIYPALKSIVLGAAIGTYLAYINTYNDAAIYFIILILVMLSPFLLVGVLLAVFFPRREMIIQSRWENLSPHF